jgi:autotransporter-associated beta strand protein
LNTNTTYAGSISNGSGTISLTKVGTGTLTLTGTGNGYYTGTTTINDGTLQIGNATATGTLGTGAVTNNSPVVTGGLVFNRNNSLDVPNAISGTGSIAVKGGTIYFNNASVANPISVSSGATLGGQGVITKAVTVTAGGTIEDGQVGFSGTKLTVGSLTFSGAGTINYNQPTGTNPLTVTGGVTTNGAGSVSINIYGTSLNNGTYDLIKYGTSITNINAFTLVTVPPSGALRAKIYSLVDNSGNKEVDLSVTGADNNITWVGALGAGVWDSDATVNWKMTAPPNAASKFYIGDNVTFDDSGAKTVNISSADVQPSSVTFTNTVGNDYIIQGAFGIANGPSLHKASGAGKVTILTNNSYNGGTTINAGTISIAADGLNAGNSAPLGVVPLAATAGNVVINGGTLNSSNTITLHANRGVALGPTFGFTGSGTIDVDNGQEFTVAGVVANNGDPVAGYGTGNLIKTGLGTLTLSNANTFSGTTTISGGILRLGNPLALQNSTLNYIYPGGTGGTISFGALTGTIGDGHSGTTPETGITNIQGLNGSQDLSISNDTGGAVLFQVGNGSVDCAYSGAITGAGSLLKTGTGTMTLTGNSSYSGATYFNRGNVIVSAGGLATGAAMHIANDVPGYGSGSSIATVTFSGSSISSFSALDIGTNSRAGGNFTIQDSASVTVTGNFDVNNEETAGGDSTVTTNNQINLNGGTLIFNGGTFIKSNNQIGHAHLAAINFNGGTIMGYGTLLPADDYSAVTGAVMYFEGVTCNVQAGGAKIDDGGNTIQINHALVHDPAIVSPATDGGLTKSGAGTLILTGTNTYTGGTIVNAGTLQLGYNNTNLSGGTLGTGGVVLNNSSVLSFNRSDSFTIANLISGNGSVIQQCYGSTAILTAANTYTGATTVSQGTLSLNGVQATSGVTVNSGAGLAVGSSGMTIGTLTFGSTDTDTETLSCTGSSITTINVTSSNGLTAYGNGSTTGTYVNPGLQVYQTGTYALVNYKGTIQGSGFGAFVLALPIRVVGSLTNNTNDPSNPYIKLQITDVNYPVWTGTVLNVGTGTYDWNIGNLNPDGTPGSGIQNWKEYSNPSVATVYQEGPPADAVFFDNSATHTTVNITTTVSPSLVTVNNTTKTYSFIGDYGIGGTGSLIKSGSGTLTIATTNSYSGGTTLNDGTLNINKATALGTGMFTINGGTIDNTSGADIVMSNNNAQTWNGVFAFTGTKNLDFGTGAVTLAGSSSITIGGTGNLKVDHIASSTYDLTKAGAGTLSLTGSYLDTSVSTLYISGSFGALNLTGGTLEIANDTHVTGLSGSGTIQPYLTADKWFFVNNALGADYSFSGVIQSGAGKMGLNKNGSGTLTLTGSNTYTGTTTVVLGNLTVSGSGGINTGGLGLIVVGDTDYTGNAASITFQNSTISSFASLNFGGGVRSGGNFTIGDTASVTVIGNFDLNNEIAGSQIATNNIVSLNGGTLTVGAFTKTSTGLTGNDATHLATINFNGGTLTGNGTILPALIGLTAKVQLGGAKINVSDGYGIEIDQPMIHDTALGTAADGGLTKSGAGTLLITGSNNFNGDTVISLGGLTLDNSFALGSSTLYYDNQGGTLSFGSLVNVTLGGLKGAESKALINGSSAAIALTVGTNDFDNTYTGILSGSGSTLTKTGTGTQILGGNNSYTGATTVNNGTLELSTNGQIAAASAISTGSSGTFEVNGGTHTVSTISGSGTTKVLGDGSLTATSIVQDTLDIGSGSWATLNIAAFDGGSTSGSLSEVPEPATWAMLMLAAMGLGIYWRRRR